MFTYSTIKLSTTIITTQLYSNINLEGIVRETVPKCMGNLGLVKIEKLSFLHYIKLNLSIKLTPTNTNHQIA